MRWSILLFSLVWMLIQAGCGYRDEPEEPEEDTGEPACIPGETEVCFCVEGDGIRACKDDGSEFSDCDCGGTGEMYGCLQSGIWYDNSTGLCWEDQITDEQELEWIKAIEHCEQLSLGGHSDWRLPTIAELRSVIRGCASTQSDGDCPIVAGDYSGSWRDMCDGCSHGEGPGSEGAYTVSTREESWFNEYWSTATDVSDPGEAWFVDFRDASLGKRAKRESLHLNCVRSGM